MVLSGTTGTPAPGVDAGSAVVAAVAAVATARALPAVRAVTAFLTFVCQWVQQAAQQNVPSSSLAPKLFACLQSPHVFSSNV